MERSESGDEQAIEDDCGTMKPDAAEETYDNYNVGLLEECASVHGAGTQQPATEQPKKSSENDDVIVCISDSDSEDSILEVASDEQVFSNSDEVDNEQEEEKESENSSEEAQEEDSDVSFDSSEESRTQDSEVVCLDSPDEEPPAQDSDESKDSLNPDFWKCIENSNDEEVSKPTTLGGVSFDLTGDSSDEETNPTVADKSTGDLLSGAASEQVAVSNDVKESMKELPAESSVEAAESQLPNEKKNTPVPSGDNAEQQRDSAQSTKNADMGRVVPYIGTTGGDISDGNSTAVMKYRSPTLANTSGSIMYRQSGLPFCRRNEMHYLDKLLSAVYPKFHTEPVYTKTRGGYEYTRLLQLYSRKKRKTKRAGASSNSRDVILRSPFYEGPTRYGGASALRSSRDSRMLQVPLPVRQSANQYQLTTPLLSSTSQSLQNSPPDEPNEPRQSTTRTNESFLRARSWNTPYTIARRPRFPMKELVIPTVGELLQYKRQMQINDKPHELEEVRDPDTEMDTSENTSSAYVVASNIQTPSPADTVSTAGKSDSKQITKIKPAVTRTRPSTATSGSDLFAPAPRLELPNVALPGLTSLPKLDLPPEFCFGPGSSQPAWKMMNSVNSSAEKQQQQQQHHLPLATVPPSISFQFIHPEILGSWTLDDMNLISLDRQFDFVGPVSLETDSVLGSEISIQSDSGPSTKLVPFAQLPKTGAGKWECPTCMVFNEQTINRCVACDCPQPRAKEVAGSSAMTPNQSSAATSASFYDSSRSTKLVPFAQLPKTGAGKWECPSCMVFNEQTINRCVACDCPQPRTKEVAGSSAMTPNQSSAATSASFYDSSRSTKLVPFAQLPKTGAGKWECPTCMVFNEQTINRCVACDCPQPRAKELAGKSAMTPNQSSAATSASFYDSSRPTKLVPFAQLPKTGAGKWECPTCMVFNEQTINRCVACDCPQPRAKEVAGSSAMTPNQSSAATSASFYDSSRSTKLVPFAQLPKTGAGKWECPTCMVFNEQTINRCVACDCPQPRAKEVAGSSAMTPNQSSAATSASFYDSSRSTKLVPFAQLPKTGAGKWECPTCMVFNEQTINRCVACDCPQPRAKEVAGSSAMTPNQWEYSKCRTRYDEAEMKNACCEQPKPSTSKQPVVVSSETPEQTVAYAPLTLSPAGFERMPVATAEMKESNHIFSKCTFVAPTEGTFGNAGKFTADSRTANQTNLGNTSAIRTLPTVPHSSITPIGVTGFSIAPVFKFGDPSIQNPSVATEQLPHLVECGLGGIDGMHGMRRVTSVKRVNFAEGDRWAAM